MTPAGTTLRAATGREAVSLTDLERRTNTIALAHVFDPATHRFPTADVQDRWDRLVDDPTVDVTVAVEADAAHGAHGGPVLGVVTVGDDRVGHLLVDPAWWGTGLGGVLLDHAVASQRAAGRPGVELTCLVGNTRARRFYAKHGWREGGPAGHAPWPPYPPQLTYALDLRRPRPRTA